MAAYEHVPVGIVETSLDGQYIEINEEFCRIMDYSRAELLQLSIKDCTHEDDYAIDSKLHEQLVTGKIPFYKLEKRYIRKSGEVIWVELTRTLVCDEKGKPRYAVGVILDISERKDVERVLHESVERLRLATEAAEMFMWEWDLQNQSYTLPDNFEQVLGFSTGLLPKNRFDTIARFVPQDDVQLISQAFQKALEDRGDMHGLPCRVINPENGQIVWLEISAKIIYDDEKRPERVFGVAQNITASKKAQDEIAIISRFPAENPNPVMRLTQDGNILYANLASQELLEYWKQELNQTIPDGLQEVVSEAFTTGMKKQIEIKHHGKYYSCTLAPILEAGYVNFYGNEITERKRAEAGLQLARRQAEQSADRMARLQKVTAALSDALTPPRVAEVVTNQGAPALGAVSSSVMWLVEDGETLEMVYSTSQESNIRPYKRFPVSLQIPAADVVRSGRTVWIESRQQYLERYPHIADQINRWGLQAAIAVPMIYKEQIFGVLTLSFDRVFPYSPDDLDYALTLARQGAQAFERARAADVLRESEERFRALVSQATAGITQSDMDGELVFVNSRFCEMLGYSEEELLGKTIWQLTDPDDLDENQRLFQRMLHLGESYQIEKRFFRKDGSRLWTSVSVSSIRDLDGNAKGGVGVIIDIEQRKQAQGALAEFARQQEALYQLSDRLHRTDSLSDIFNAALDAIINALQCDRASILLFDDSEVMRFMAWRGLSDRYRKATDGHSPWKPDSRDPEPISMDDVRTAELDESLRTVILEEGIRSLAFIPLVSNGKLIGKFMIYFDSPHVFGAADLDLSLTIANQLAFGIERKRAEEALRIENERFMRFVDSNIVGILIGRANGEVILANDYYLRLLGVSRQELMERHVDWKQFTPPEWLPADEKAIRELNENGVCEPYEKEYVRADGTRVPVYITNAMLPGPGEEIAAFVIDMTERKRAAEALRLSEQRFRGIFETAGVSVWVEDFTEVKQALEELRAQGVQDFRAYFAEHPDFVREAVKKVHILDVNKETLVLFGARSKDDLLQSLGNVFLPETEPAFVEELIALAEGREVLNAESVQQTLDGHPISVIFTAHFGPATGDLSRVVVTLTDITERKRSENMLRIRARQQQAIAQLGELALRERDVQKVLEQSTAMIAQTLEIENCKVLELLEEKNTLLLRAGVGWQEGLVGNATVGAGLDSQAGFTLQSDTPVIVDDLQTEQRFHGPPLLFTHNIISGMSCIIHRADGKPWGV
ncbi:MAG TPA: PAS domain S-box protein, partial [Anaerolineales bacterium]